ncbi:hypothetical protein FJTKL_03970 [Diaporthe vaccinii]|uniref:Uncharacterized protein n=1 Tax=Diaporthe vaccinii TaxID=105482 RepID=A0ABR4F1Q1_9PEZI
MRLTAIASLSTLLLSLSTRAQDDVNAAASFQEATFWHRCPDKDNLNLDDGLSDCDCTRDGKPWWDWFGKKTCTVVVTQTVGGGETTPGIPQPTTPGCDQDGHCTVTVTQTVGNGGTPGIPSTTTEQPSQPFPTQTQPGFTQPTQTFSNPTQTFGNPTTTTIGQPGFPTQTSSLLSSVVSSASSSFSSIESQASSQISSVSSQASSELSSLTSKLSTATGADRSSITSEIGRLTSSAASRASSISSEARTSIFRTGAAAPLQTAGVAMGALFGGVAVLANI